MDYEDNNQNLSCLQTFLIIAILTTACLVPAWALIWRNTVNEPAAVVIGQAVPRVEATPNPVFIALIERAKAAATVEVIKANADANSQATDDEIRLRWNVHHMRRFWAWYAIPALLALSVGLAVYVLGYQRH